MTTVETIETITTDLAGLADAVQSAQQNYDQAHATPEARRQAVADAEAAAVAYETRIAEGLPGSASTLASKRDAVELARLALPGAEAKESEAQDVLRSATVQLVCAQVSDEFGSILGATAKQAVRDQVDNLVRQAIGLVSDYVTERNAALADARCRLVAAGAPAATRATLALPETVHEAPESLVHVYRDGSGIRVLGREVVTARPSHEAAVTVARVVKSILPATVWPTVGLRVDF
jgi:hypothetical protein